MPKTEKLYLCLTTVAHAEQAKSLASSLIEERLAACVQIDAPVTSYYRWKGNAENEQELRLQIYAPASTLEKLSAFVLEKHPYETPKWVCVEAEKVSEKYLKWANDACNFHGFI